MPDIRIKDCKNCHVAHDWYFGGASLQELRSVKRMTGMTGMQFSNAFQDMDPDALAALLVILHKRIKISVSIDEVDIDFDDFDLEPTEDELEEIARLEAEMKAKADEAQAPKVG